MKGLAIMVHDIDVLCFGDCHFPLETFFSSGLGKTTIVAFSSPARRSPTALFACFTTGTIDLVYSTLCKTIFLEQRPRSDVVHGKLQKPMGNRWLHKIVQSSSCEFCNTVETMFCLSQEKKVEWSDVRLQNYVLYNANIYLSMVLQLERNHNYATVTNCFW